MGASLSVQNALMGATQHPVVVFAAEPQTATPLGVASANEAFKALATELGDGNDAPALVPHVLEDDPFAKDGKVVVLVGKRRAPLLLRRLFEDARVYEVDAPCLAHYRHANRRTVDGSWLWFPKHGVEHMDDRFWRCLGIEEERREENRRKDDDGLDDDDDGLDSSSSSSSDAVKPSFLPEHVPGSWTARLKVDDEALAQRTLDDHVRTKGRDPYFCVVRYPAKDRRETVTVFCRGQGLYWDDRDNEPILMAGLHIDVSALHRDFTTTVMRMSHEIKTPLVSLAGAFELLDEARRGSKPADEHVNDDPQNLAVDRRDEDEGKSKKHHHRQHNEEEAPLANTEEASAAGSWFDGAQVSSGSDDDDDDDEAAAERKKKKRLTATRTTSRHDTKDDCTKGASPRKESDNADMWEIGWKSLSQLQDVIADVILLSQLDVGGVQLTKKRVNVGSLVRDVLRLTRGHFAARDQRVDVEDGADLCCCCEISEFHVRLVLVNLVTNASKYSPPNSDVTVRWALKEKKDDDDDPKSPDGCVLVVDVEDRGIGIPEEFWTSIFKEGFRTREARSHLARDETSGSQSTGLGLAIVAKLCKQMGGHVFVLKSSPGSTIFRFTLPTTRADGDDGDDSSPESSPQRRKSLGRVVPAVVDDPKEAPSQKKEEDDETKKKKNDESTARVLVVDDVPLNRLVAKRQLQKHGFKSVTDAPGGLAAVALLSKEHYDVLIVDMHMPDLDGDEVIRQCRFPRDRTFLWSAAGDVQALRDTASELGVGVLGKPFASTDTTLLKSFLFENRPPPAPQAEQQAD